MLRCTASTQALARSLAKRIRGGLGREWDPPLLCAGPGLVLIYKISGFNSMRSQLAFGTTV